MQGYATPLGPQGPPGTDGDKDRKCFPRGGEAAVADRGLEPVEVFGVELVREPGHRDGPGGSIRGDAHKRRWVFCLEWIILRIPAMPHPVATGRGPRRVDP